MKELVNSSPVELIMAISAFISVKLGSSDWTSADDGMLLFPAVLMLSMSLNTICKGKLRLFYYLSLLFIIFINLDGYVSFLGGKLFFINISAVLLFLLLHSRRDDATLAVAGYNFIRNMLRSAIVVYSAVFLITLIMASIDYIFGVKTIEFLGDLYFFAILVVWPVAFIDMFGKSGEVSLGKFHDILLSKILIPALLLYAVILYLYFAVIVFNWELPKGGIAYMTMTFIVLSMLAGLLRRLSSASMCNFFFNRLSFMLLPVLVMFWVAVIYRVCEYGFTEARVLIVALGIAISSAISVMCVGCSGKSYFRAMQVLLFLFVATLFVPVRYISVESQKSRAEHLVRELGWSKENGLFSFDDNADRCDFTEEKWNMYLELKEVLRYLNKKDELAELPVPEEKIYLSMYGDCPLTRIPDRFKYYIDDYAEVCETDVVVETAAGKVRVTYKDILAQMLARTGEKIDRQFINNLHNDVYDKHFYYYEHEDFMLLFHNIELIAIGNELKIKSLCTDAVFLKEQP